MSNTYILKVILSHNVFKIIIILPSSEGFSYVQIFLLILLQHLSQEQMGSDL